MGWMFLNTLVVFHFLAAINATLSLNRDRLMWDKAFAPAITGPTLTRMLDPFVARY